MSEKLKQNSRRKEKTRIFTLRRYYNIKYFYPSNFVFGQFLKQVRGQSRKIKSDLKKKFRAQQYFNLNICPKAFSPHKSETIDKNIHIES